MWFEIIVDSAIDETMTIDVAEEKPPRKAKSASAFCSASQRQRQHVEIGVGAGGQQAQAGDRDGQDEKA